MIIGNHKRATLGIGQIGERDCWDFGEAEGIGGGEASVPGDNRAIGSEENWIGETEFRDAGGDLGDLSIAMRTSIGGVWLKLG